MTRPAEWSPHLWEGLDYFAFWRLLARGRFRVGRRQLHVVAVMSVVTLANTILGWLQRARHGRDLRRTPLPASPLFVLGHWRTGTTLLHELLMLDPRFTTPSTHDCFLPHHNLLSAGFVQRYLAFVMPKQRPMDAMPAGWERPQEDEFALALFGEPSTYTDIAFPNGPPLDYGALDLSSLDERQKRRWRRTLAHFVRTLTLRDPRRLVLKSPPHTARVPELLKLFPGAKFVHIRRDPLALYSSTLNLWYSLALSHGLQTPHSPAQFEAKVLREFRVIYETYFATRHLIPAGNLVEICYEELARDLVGGVRAVYDGLALGGFAEVEPRLRHYAEANRGYRRNTFSLDPATEARVRAAWGDLVARLGYG